MAQMRWSIRNYNAFIKEAKHSYGVNHATAQAFYRSMRGHLGVGVRAIDLDRHPRITKKAYKEATKIHREVISPPIGGIAEPPDWVIEEIGGLPSEIDIEWWTDNYLDEWGYHLEEFDEYEAMYETTQGEK